MIHLLFSLLATIFFSRLFRLPRQRPAMMLIAAIIVIILAWMLDRAMLGWDIVGAGIAIGTESMRRQLVRASSL